MLDFGLAKLTQTEPALAGGSQLPTTPPHTLPGVVLGTVGYMAPEQVRGLTADHRSDIFAFGAVLYEMLSGRRAFRGETAPDTMTAILKEDPVDLPVVGTPFEERGGQFSPDGRWVAYQSNESGRFEIYVQPFPGPGGKWQVSTAGGTDPRWRVDGKELFFLAPDARLMAVPVRASNSTFEAGSPAALFQTRTVVGGAADLRPQYAVSRDGRFLFNVPADISPTTPITVVLNWNPRLK